MPRPRNSAAATKSAEAENAVEADDQNEYAAENDMEETFEEEVEYEVVEEEIEEEVEEEVEEEEEEVEEDEDEENDMDRDDAQKGRDTDDDMENTEEEEEVRKKHAELLALPPHGSEVYLGGFSKDTTEEDLRSFCWKIGEVTEVRIMKGKDSNENKGYAFVIFRSKEFASKAIHDLNNTELKGRKLKCSASQAKNRLFIGNIPRNWGEDDTKKVVRRVGPGVVLVELLKFIYDLTFLDQQNSSRNRGFAFIEYYNRACAEYSRQRMSNSNFKLDDNAPTVSWADPKSVESSSSQVKAVYVKNLPKDVTQDQLKELFEHHGGITKVVLPPAKPGHERSRYGFVHFSERSSAMKAIKNSEKYDLGGQVLECSLARPPADQKADGGSSSQKSAVLPSYPPHVGYGLVGAPYGALGAAVYSGPGFAQPIMYGRGHTSGMAMMPMLLPDGRIGYVLQQPRMLHQQQPHSPRHHQQRGGRNSGGSLSGGRRGGGGRESGYAIAGCRYNPY